MTDIEQEPRGDHGDDVVVYVIHVVKGAARPAHTLLAGIERTARWTLRTVLAGTIEEPHFDHWTSSKGNRFSSTDTLYYDN